MSEAKERDAERQKVMDLFTVWWTCHGDVPIAASDLHHDVKQVADPQNRGRQYLSAYLETLADTRMAGFVMTRQSPAGRWGTATYALRNTAAAKS